MEKEYDTITEQLRKAKKNNSLTRLGIFTLYYIELAQKMDAFFNKIIKTLTKNQK